MHNDAIPAWLLALVAASMGIGMGIASDWEKISAVAVLGFAALFVTLALGIHIGVANARYEHGKNKGGL
jgi:nitroreductase